MKKTLGKGWWLAGVMVALFLSLPAQKGFNQQEKESIQKYKRAKVHYLKGGEYLQKGKFEKARKEADACLEIFPGFADARLLLAQTDYQQGQFATALKEIETAQADFRKFSKFYEYSYLEYLDLLREQRDIVEKHISDLTMQMAISTDDDAKQAMQDTINKDKQTRDTLDGRLRNPIPETLAVPAEYHYTHGNILFKMKRFGEAEGFYLEAIQADPKHANAYNNLINILYMRGDMAQALKYLNQAEANGVQVLEGLKKAVLEKQPR
jgi:tetratricopeptide (TPR) repeat protein